jgi:hypothetical protein
MSKRTHDAKLKMFQVDAFSSEVFRGNLKLHTVWVLSRRIDRGLLEEPKSQKLNKG